MRFYSILKKIAFPVGRSQRSVCIGTWRLTFAVTFETNGLVVIVLVNAPVSLHELGQGRDHGDGLLHLLLHGVGILHELLHEPLGGIRLVRGDDVPGCVSKKASRSRS